MTTTSTADRLQSDDPTELEHRLAEPITRDPASQALALRDGVDYARTMAQADVLPKSFQGKPGNVLWAIAYSRALELKPPVVMQNLTVIDGNVGMKADLIATLVRRAGHRLRQGGHLDENGLPVGWAEIVRKDDPDHVVRAEWDIPRAVRAGLCSLKDGQPYCRSNSGKPLPWEAHPSTQVKRRAVGEAARDACPEVLLGVSLEDELDEVRATGADQAAAAVVAPNRPGADIRAAAAAVQTPPAAATEPAPAEDVVDAHVLEDQPVADDVLKRLHTALTRAGHSKRDDRLAYVRGVINDPALASTKSLTAGQAGLVFESLGATPAQPEPETPTDSVAEAVAVDPDADERGRLAIAIGKAAEARGMSVADVQEISAQRYGKPLAELDMADRSDVLDLLQSGERS